MRIEYDGTNFVGWQSQKNGDSVQDNIEKVLKKILKEKIRISGAGRTDKGVHADMHVTNFFADKDYPLQAIMSALNFYLPSDIRVLDVCLENKSFNARYSAVSRTYIYSFTNHSIPFCFHDFITFFNYSFDFKNLNSLLTKCIGLHDFVNFRN